MGVNQIMKDGIEGGKAVVNKAQDIIKGSGPNQHQVRIDSTVKDNPNESLDNLMKDLNIGDLQNLNSPMLI